MVPSKYVKRQVWWYPLTVPALGQIREPGVIEKSLIVKPHVSGRDLVSKKTRGQLLRNST